MKGVKLSGILLFISIYGRHVDLRKDLKSSGWVKLALTVDEKRDRH